MILLQFTSVKNFMAHLLLSDTFDNFQLTEGEITTFNTFKIDGYIQKNFFEKGKEDIPEYSYWRTLREYCFSLIRGKRTPLSFHFVFRLSPENVIQLVRKNNLDFEPENILGLYLNINYDGSRLKCTTGTALKIFTLDKSLEQTFDKMTAKFFAMKHIEFERI